MKCTVFFFLLAVFSGVAWSLEDLVPVDPLLGDDVGLSLAGAKTSLDLANNVINDADSSILKRRRKKKMRPLKSAAADKLEKKQQLDHLFSQDSSSSMTADAGRVLQDVHHRQAKFTYVFEYTTVVSAIIMQ